jgi:hypothetical protein
MRNEDHPLIDCPHRGCARDRQDHEQRLQEQPSRVVRSNVHRTAPHTNWVEVTSRRFPPPSVVVSRTQLGEKTDDVALSDIRYTTHYGLKSDIARGPKRVICVVRARSSHFRYDLNSGHIIASH